MNKKHSASSEERSPKKQSGFRLALPFLIVLGTISLISFVIPLRPTQSYMEKRMLATFPTFSLSALEDGRYFQDITEWFSDTFPGREQWLTLSSDISSLHGYSEIEILGEMPAADVIPPTPPETQPTAVTEASVPEITVPETTVPETTVPVTTAPETTAPETTAPETTVPETTVPEITVPEITVPETTVPEITVPETTAPETQPGWGGLDLENAGDLEFANTVIQIGNAVFNPVGFSQVCSDRYAQSLSSLSQIAASYGARVISAPAPTAVGVLVSAKDQERLHCVDQNQILQYLHSQMDDSIITVDTFSPLVAHNSEYIYFRTDHHWTARGAYYAYRAICDALEYTPVPLEELEEMDQGVFEGSLYWKAPHPKKLTLDTLIAYQPQGDFTLNVCNLLGYGTEHPLIQDMAQRERNTKYSAFLFGDNALVEVTNHALSDGPTCLVVKDSFGNALVPFLAQNYSKVYAIDYRKFGESTIRGFLMMHPVDDILFAPYIIATQAVDGNEMFHSLCS